MHSLYFIGYALMATVSGVVIAWAQYSRKKTEGTPMNFTLLKVIFGVALAMWCGAALASAAYTTTTTTTAIAGFAIGVILSAVLVWQIKAVILKIESDEQALRELATRDALTDLWNLRIFHETLKLEIARSVRFGHPLSLIIMDIDHFKAVNDTHGYKVGDIVLRELGRRLLVTARTIDSVCRYGGEEIALILPATDIASAGLFAQRIQREVLEPVFEIGNGTLEITASFGIATISQGIQTDTKLIIAAHAALDAAKEGGRNRICVHD